MVAPKMTYTLGECMEKLSLSGLPIGVDALKDGLAQGCFPFGFVIAPDHDRKQPKYIIFKKDVEDFIRVHGGEVRYLRSERGEKNAS